MAWTSRKRRKRYRTRLGAGSGGDRKAARRPASAGPINGGQGLRCAVDWSEASLADLRLLRYAIRHGWAENLSRRRKRRIVGALGALLSRPETPVRMRISIARAFIEMARQDVGV